MLKFALAGNPNCGKTTLFNTLTGSTAHVGNWPGVTVDKREGVYKKLSEHINIVDLPGIYSLSPYTPEEVVSRNFILEEKPDCVINIVDATNLERNLYLTTQIMEIDVPVVVALNMIDVVKKSGDKLDAKKLEREIGVPVVEISALKEEGVKELMERALEAAKQKRDGKTVLAGTPLDHVISDVRIALKGKGVDNPLFHAVKLTEGDELEVASHPEEMRMVEEFKAQFKDDVFEGDFEAMVADERYKYISTHFSGALTRVPKKENLSKSDKADKVLTHRIWGIPIFLVILFAVFHLTFGTDLLYLNAIFGFANDVNTGNGVLDAFVTVFYSSEGISTPGAIVFNFMGFITDQIGGGIALGMENAGAAEWAQGLVNDGIWGGLSGILSFIPQILVLFLFIYSGRQRLYGARGVHTRQSVPQIRSFGPCVYPHDHGVRLFRACGDQHQNAGGRKGTHHDQPRDPLLHVRRKGAHPRGCVRRARGALHQSGRRSSDFRTLRVRHGNGGRHGRVHAADFHARRSAALHHGTSRVSRAAVPQFDAAPLG